MSMLLSKIPSTLPRWQTSIILLWLTPDNFPRQGESSCTERDITASIKHCIT